MTEEIEGFPVFNLDMDQFNSLKNYFCKIFWKKNTLLEENQQK